jgi:hypothetical protein
VVADLASAGLRPAALLLGLKSSTLGSVGRLGGPAGRRRWRECHSQNRHESFAGCDAVLSLGPLLRSADDQIAIDQPLAQR